MRHTTASIDGHSNTLRRCAVPKVSLRYQSTNTEFPTLVPLLDLPDCDHLRSRRAWRGLPHFLWRALPRGLPRRKRTQVVWNQEGRQRLDLPSHDMAGSRCLPRVCSRWGGPLRRLRRFLSRVAPRPCARLRVESANYDRRGSSWWKDDCDKGNR